MATTTLVDQKIEDGRKIIVQLAKDKFEVAIAFWVKFRSLPDDTYARWHFYIVSPKENTVGVTAAYRALHTSIGRISPPLGPWNFISDLRLVSTNDLFAGKVFARRQQYPTDKALLLRSVLIGDFAVEEMYIYPSASELADAANAPTLAEINEEAKRLKGFVETGDKEKALSIVDHIIAVSGVQPNKGL